MDILKSGEELTEDFMADIVTQRIQSASVANYGNMHACRR
jgi:hypothetical protein